MWRWGELNITPDYQGLPAGYPKNAPVNAALSTLGAPCVLRFGVLCCSIFQLGSGENQHVSQGFIRAVLSKVEMRSNLRHKSWYFSPNQRSCH